MVFLILFMLNSSNSKEKVDTEIYGIREIHFYMGQWSISALSHTFFFKQAKNEISATYLVL